MFNFTNIQTVIYWVFKGMFMSVLYFIRIQIFKYKFIKGFLEIEK